MRSAEGGDSLLVPLLTYALRHATPGHLLVSLFGIGLLGCLLEARVGSKTTALVIVTGVFLVGLTWKFLVPVQGSLIGSAGVAYTMAGGMARVGRQFWADMGRGERLIFILSALWATLMLVSDLRNSPASGIIPVMAISAGYVVVAARFGREPRHPGAP